MRNLVRSVIRPSSAVQRRLDVVGAVDPLADVVQQRRQQELLVVGPAVAGQLEHLQRVIQHVAFGMILRPICCTFSSGKSSMRKIG